MTGDAAHLAGTPCRERRGRLPGISLRGPTLRTLLARGRRRQQSRPQPVRPPHRTHARSRRRRQVDRRRDGPARRSPRSHLPQPGPYPRSSDTLEEARAFLSEPAHIAPRCSGARCRATATAAARRLFAASRPLAGTLAQDLPALARHHRSASRFRRCASIPPATTARTITLPLKPGPPSLPPSPISPATSPACTAPGSRATERPRRLSKTRAGRWATSSATPSVSAPSQDVLAAGEGIETMLSLKTLLPGMPMAAALSANHLAALLLPPSLRRLYVAADNDKAGLRAAARLMRARRRKRRLKPTLCCHASTTGTPSSSSWASPAPSARGRPASPRGHRALRHAPDLTPPNETPSGPR